MNPEIKDRWLQKLRSGQYDQIKGELWDGEGFCCLGVLCEVAVEDGIIKRNEDFNSGYTAPLMCRDDSGDDREFYRENSILPTVVKEWAGLDDNNPAVEMKGFYDPDDDSDVELSELNDSAGYTFEDIANIIEDKL